MNRDPQNKAESANVLPVECAELVSRALLNIKASLDYDVAELAARRPQITDAKQSIAGAAITAAQLAGGRTMLNTVAEALGLTKLE